MGEWRVDETNGEVLFTKTLPVQQKKTNDWRDDDDAAPNSSLNCQDFIDFYLQHRDEFRKGDE